MDIYGFVLLAIGVALWLVTRKRHPRLASFAVLIAGIGIGIVIGAIWAYSIVSNLIP